MESMSRRMLLTSGSMALVGVTFPVVNAARGKKDEVGDHILREGKRLARNLKDGIRPHETISGLAANLRLHAAHVRATGVEATVAQAVNRRVSRRGRRGLIEDSKSPQVMQRHHDQLREFGLEDLHVTERDATPDEEERTLTMLQTSGQLSDALEQMAAAFDQFAEKQAFVGDGNVHIVRVQGSIDAWCGTMRTICEMMKTAVQVICALSASGFAELAPLCALLGVEIATACLLAWLGGC